jgi:hypothetical protein
MQLCHSAVIDFTVTCILQPEVSLRGRDEERPTEVQYILYFMQFARECISGVSATLKMNWTAFNIKKSVGEILYTLYYVLICWLKFLTLIFVSCVSLRYCY